MDAPSPPEAQTSSPPKRKVPDMEAGTQADTMMLEEDQPVRHKEPRWEPATHPRDDQAASPNRRYFRDEIDFPGHERGDWNTHQQPPDAVRLLSTVAQAQDAAQDAAQGAPYTQEAPNARWVAHEPQGAPLDRSSSAGSAGVMLFGCNISISPPASRDFQNPCGTAEPAEPLDRVEQRRAGRAASYSTRETAISSNPAWGRSASARISTPAGGMAIDDLVYDDAANAPQIPTSNSFPTARIRSQPSAAYYTLAATESAAAQPDATLASASASATIGIADGRSPHPWGVAAPNRTSAEINPADLAFARRLLETNIRDDATLRSATDPSRSSHTRETFQEAASRSATDFREGLTGRSWSGGALDDAVHRGAAEKSPPAERLRLVVQALQDEPPPLNPESTNSGAVDAAAGSSGFAFGGWPYTPAALQALLATHAANAAAPRAAATAPPPGTGASAEVALSRHPHGASSVAAQGGLTLNPPRARLDPPADVLLVGENARRVAAPTTAGEAAPMGSSPTRRNAGNDRGAANTMGDGSTSATGGALIAETGDGARKTVSPRRRFRCTVCDRRFSSGQALGGHSRMHAMQQRAQEEMDR
ncbi:unnamed protein product [Closterium sp. Yama58-4]|nr:unnamed protein product [Closterium sp. Yama58-4]